MKQELYIIQLAINSATAPLQKEIERLRGEVGRAWRECQQYNPPPSDIQQYRWNNSRAKRVAEGKE